MTQPELKCGLCKKKYIRDAAKQRRSQERKGCFEILSNPAMEYKPKHSMEGNQKIVYYKCPALLYDRAVADLINYYHLYEKGIMPYEGSYYDQPSKFVELMDLVHNLVEENKAEINKKQEEYGKRSRS